ncbi:uncharacterized protein LOC125336976 isoform X8 [Corvus hawaiiensis]|uniref:uncharacterized protein LOC125336976 isoform X8 n=1 Tax=Corvus hawaiiensis TaxID=134902 RepID=UPI00201A0357|nr:uncharacterized protein LOC125336976 isoform X8 [Corvus hawaiiensis]
MGSRSRGITGRDVGSGPQVWGALQAGVCGCFCRGIPWKQAVPKGFHGNTSFLLSCGCLSKGIPWKHTIPAFLWVFVQGGSMETHSSKGIPWKHVIPAFLWVFVQRDSLEAHNSFFSLCVSPEQFPGSTQFQRDSLEAHNSTGIPWKHTVPAFLWVFVQGDSMETHNSCFSLCVSPKQFPGSTQFQGDSLETQFPLSCGCLSKGIHWKHTIPEGFHGSTQFQRDSLEAHNPLFRFNLVPPPRSAGLFPGLQKSHKNVEFRPAGALSPFDPDQSPAPKGVLLQGWEGSLLLRRPAPGQAALPGETEAGMGQT